MKTKGSYRKGFPEGLVVHYDAGAGNPLSTIKTALQKGYCYFVIGTDGKVYQNFQLNRHGSHAGRSFWQRLGDSVSNKLVGVEICCAGKLEKKGDRFFTWFGKEVPLENVRFTPGKDNQARGFYMKYTPAQEAALIELCLWLYEQNPDVFSLESVLGHDEACSPKGRKVDPGAALSVTMPEFRTNLRELYGRSR